ncbi:MAG TPA: LytTR family DNA-binding domain-containing protein [Saprospiraceae bacterium]|nr:LytTR family DNA-binding domain-containing protein [Saprospiraceae bacterium]HND89316.1 LytTR family DNA-binding domain-containing protein [Saprospiraceae bacterium]
MKVLIIEDEIPAARQFSKLLHAARPQVQVLETLDSVASAVRWLRTFSAPDLIFMDIQIADGLSFDIFRQVDVLSPVVFTTAFDQYAVQAFKVNAVDYLLKPVDPDDLEAALQKWEQRQPAASAISVDALLQHFQRPAHKDRFLVKSGQQLIFLADQDIAWFRSSEGLTQACTFTGKKYFVEHTLEELDRLLNPREFFRVGRGLTVGLRSIHKIHPHLNGRLKLELQPASADDTFVSRERVGEFKAWLGG